MNDAMWDWLSWAYERLPTMPALIMGAGMVVVIVLLVYFWAWYAWPKFLVPLHLSVEELRVLRLQDQLRRTQIQIPIVVALVATFILVIVQFVMSSRQWTVDAELRSKQVQMTEFVDAIKVLAIDKPETTSASIYALQYLVGMDVDHNIRRIYGMLAAIIRSRTSYPRFGSSEECNEGSVGTHDREDAPEEVQAAMTVLGDKLYGRNFESSYDYNSSECIARSDGQLKLSQLAYRPVLEHRFLDNLDLAQTDFSCARFSGSRFRRTSFQWSTLKGADFRAAVFEEKDIIPLRALAEAATEKGGTAAMLKWIHDTKETGWKRYRCWSAFFQYALLDGAKFDGAWLTGAVFEGASLRKARFAGAWLDLADFRGADVTLADFRGAGGLEADQLMAACAEKGKPPLHSLEIAIEFKECPRS